MSNTKLIIILVFTLALGWSIFYWQYTWQSTIGQMVPSSVDQSVAAAADALPPLNESPTDATATIPTGSDVTSQLDVCGNYLCVWDLSEGTPFALLNYCAGQNQSQ